MAMLFCAAGARAQDPGAPTFRFSGYGTVGLVHSSENQADYTDSIFKPNGAGHSRNLSADVDSRFGLQITAYVSPQLSAVLQVISKQRYDNTYVPSVEWANLKYAITQDFNIRLGRIAMPTFLVGEYRNVGYALPWVRPPVDLYSLLPVTNNDGVDATYRFRFGEGTNTLQGIFGRDELRSPGSGARTIAKHTRGIFNTTEYGPAIFRVAYQKADLTLGSVNTFFDLLEQFGPSGIILHDKYDLDNRPISFLSFGASYDPGDWFLMGEWGKGGYSSFLGTQTSWYASGGYRFGNFTPYLTYSQSRKLSNTSDPGLDLASVPPSLVALAASLNAGLNGFLRPTTGRTVTFGSRWDFMKNTALKLQYEHIELDANSSGALINLQPGFRAGAQINLISTTIDFVF
jgi:hypothetical protein